MVYQAVDDALKKTGEGRAVLCQVHCTRAVICNPCCSARRVLPCKASPWQEQFPDEQYFTAPHQYCPAPVSMSFGPPAPQPPPPPPPLQA